MLSSLMSVVSLFFFVAIAMGGCALVGSLLFDLLPVLRDGDDRLRKPLIFPQVAERPAVRQPATIHRIIPAQYPAAPAVALRAAA